MKQDIPVTFCSLTMIPTLPVAVVMWYHRWLSKESLSPCLQSYREGGIWGLCSCLDFCCRATSSMELGVLLSPPLRRASQGQETKDTKLCSCRDLDCWNPSMHRASDLSPSASTKLSTEVGRKGPQVPCMPGSQLMNFKQAQNSKSLSACLCGELNGRREKRTLSSVPAWLWAAEVQACTELDHGGLYATFCNGQKCFLHFFLKPS